MIISVTGESFSLFGLRYLRLKSSAQLLVLSGADRSILYELDGDTFVPSAFSLKDGISFQHGESIDRDDSLFDWSNTKEYLWSESNHHLPVSSLNSCKSILYSLIKNQSGKPAAILMLHYVFKAETKTNFTCA
jgi:hypothetical protein